MELAHLCSEVAILDTGAGPNCDRRAVLPAGWETGLCDAPGMRVRDADRNKLRVNGVFSLYVQLETALMKDEFFVCEKLAVPVNLGSDITTSLFSESMPSPNS